MYDVKVKYLLLYILLIVVYDINCLVTEIKLIDS